MSDAKTEIMLSDSQLFKLRDAMMSESALVDDFREAFQAGGRDALLAHLAESEPLKGMLVGDILKLANALSCDHQIDAEACERFAAERRADVAGWCQEMREVGAWDGE